MRLVAIGLRTSILGATHLIRTLPATVFSADHRFTLMSFLLRFHFVLNISTSYISSLAPAHPVPIVLVPMVVVAIPPELIGILSFVISFVSVSTQSI